jgi:PAS domain S-box-containing protein
MVAGAVHESWDIALGDLANWNALALLTVRSDGCVFAANDALLELIGHDRRALETGGVNWIEMTSPDCRYLDFAAFEEVRAQRCVAPYEKRLVRPDGAQRSVLTCLVPTRSPEVLAVGFAIDVTEHRREAERQERWLRERAAGLEDRIARRSTELRETSAEFEAFCHTISHNLQAPLRTIQGYADLMSDELPAGLREAMDAYLKPIRVAVARMDALIRDLLSYATLVRARPLSEPVALNLAVADALDRVRERIDAAHAEIHLELSDPLPPVWGHSAELVTAISQLIVNGVTFVAPGVIPRILIVGEQRDGSVRLCVVDNGVGIAPEHQERVFWLFERIEPATGTGTGVGLALVRRAIELMNGSVGLESSPGRGSRFWIELPAAPEDALDVGFMKYPFRGVL